jgi:MFS family permease
MSLFQAAIFWHVFAITGSSFQLGLIGLVQFVPALGLSLVGGAVADRHDRRRVALRAQLLPLVCSATLCALTLEGAVSLPVIWVVVVLVAASNAFENPARMALLPQLVPRDLFPRAVTVNATLTALARTTGPVAMGFVAAWAGIGAAYAIHAALLAVAIVTLARVRPRRPAAPGQTVSWQSIREGVAFVRGRQVVLGCMLLDMFAVIFGGAVALLPVYAQQILMVGERGYGLLAASLELGAVSMSALLIGLPTVRRAGRVLLVAVAAFGVATILFGLSRSFPLSLAAYVVVGMADQVSVVMRSTIIQLSTPDELRGRVSSVNMLSIVASNQLGAAESGFVAALTSAPFAVVSGGVGCLIVVALVALRLPELRRYRVG